MSVRNRRPAGKGFSDTAGVASTDRLDSIVRAYISRCRPNSEEELGSFRGETTVAAAVGRAGLATTPTGRRYHHQRRLPGALLAFAAEKLNRAHLEDAKHFDDLYRRVEAAIGALQGIGELTIYDTALRIGARLGYLPTRVYLHAGTRAGARTLGLAWRAKTVAVRELPAPLRVLAPHEIEDCLSIFKDQLKKAT